MAFLLNKLTTNTARYGLIKQLSNVVIRTFSSKTSTFSVPTTTLIDNKKLENQQEIKNEIIQNVHSLLEAKSEGRLFAVVHLCGKQFKITPGDIILVEGYWPPTIGDKIRLEKVLLAGGKDFTLIGAPMLHPGLVDIQATIIEKTLTHTKTHFRKKRRKQYMRINFYRSPNTMIRINSIDVKGKLDKVEEEQETTDENNLKIF